VQVTSLTGIIAVSAGAAHSLFLKNDGTVWACGYNLYGQLGDGTTTDRWTPVQVSSVTGIVTIVGGYYHSLFLKNDGTARACGHNGYGQLGDGTTTDRWIPVQVTGLCPLAAGLEEEVNETEFSIYPNPTSGIFQLTVGKGQFTNAVIEIYSVLGEKVYKSEGRSHKLEVDLTGELAGVYFVRVTAGEKTLHGKIIKQ
jgi:alpha-tubulin suppressor-like RCC1 family protein